MRAASVDEYFEGIVWPEGRAALAELRRFLRELVPDGQEVISYGMPAIKRGNVVVWYAAFRSHLSLFPSGIVAEFANELVDYKVSKGTIQFTPDHPLPSDLIARIVARRLEQIG